MPDAALAVSGIQVAYGGVAALKGIDLAVAKGEFVALLGPSGCGKTSLLRTIAGFVQPQRRAVRLNGRDVAGLPPRQRNIGIVFQSYALFPHMTVLQNVLFGLECRRVGKAAAASRAAQALELVGLTNFADRRPKQLSGGQQQRVALALAIVIEPDLLLLDEPLGALDKQLRVRMQTELKALQRRLGVTAVFVTHDQEEAMSMADRIVVMRDGVVAQTAAPETLFASPNSAWVCEFVGAGNLLHGPMSVAGEGRLRMQVAPGEAIELVGTTPAGVVQLPFDRLRLLPSTDESGLVTVPYVCRTVGAGGLRTLLKVTLPAIAPSIMAAAIFVFITSFDQATVSVFLAGPDMMPLPVRIYSYIDFAVDPMVAAVSTLLIIFAFGIIALLQKVLGLDRAMGVN